MTNRARPNTRGPRTDPAPQNRPPDNRPPTGRWSTRQIEITLRRVNQKVNQGRLKPIDLLAVFVLAVGLYASTLGGTFIYDDVPVLLDDQRVRQPALWHAFLTESYNDGVDNLYRPLTSLSFAAGWYLHGPVAWPYHLVNVALYAIVCVLAARLAGVVTGSRSVGLLSGLLFAAHPVHVEAVAYVVGRAETLCAVGFLAALVIYLATPLTRMRAVAIWACFVFSLLAKEQGMLLPAALLLAGWAVRRPAESKPARQLLTILLCFSLAGYIVFREQHLKFEWDRQFLDWSIQPMIRSQGASRWLMPFVLFGRYVQLLLVPWRLSPDYGGYVIGYRVSPSDPYLYAGLIAAGAVVTAGVVAIVQGWRRILLLLGCFMITYGVISNSVSLIGTNFGERLIFLPSVFVLIAVAWGLVRVCPSPRVLAGVAGVLLLLGAARTVSYAVTWNQRLGFYQRSLDQQPRSTRLAMLLAWEQRRLGLLTRSRATLDYARQQTPDYWDVWRFSAMVALEQGDLPAARRFLRRTFEIRPELPTGDLNAQIDRAETAREARQAERAATRPATPASPQTRPTSRSQFQKK